MPIAHLEDRSVVAIAGSEARAFLQGLITNDVEKLESGKGLYAALLTPQGKILFDFFLVEGDGAILIDCLALSRDALVKRLSLYKLRSKVVIEIRDQLAVLALWHGGVARQAISYPDPRLSELGQRAIIAKGEMPSDHLSGQEYQQHRLALGVPEGADFGSDQMFALDADLDELHAIDFDKGCYVGQELTARMKHRGTARKRLLPVEFSPTSTRVTAITMEGKEIGEITSDYGARGFAQVRLDRLSEGGAAVPQAGEQAVKLIKPSWLFA
jgi:folate-binding protein YgfZ